MSLSTEELFAQTESIGWPTRLVKGVLSNETDPLFSWQFDENGVCPDGCTRGEGGECEVATERRCGKVEL